MGRGRKRTGAIFGNVLVYMDRPYTCPVCKKKFCVQSLQEYVYKTPTGKLGGFIPYCSWTCYRKVTHPTKKDKDISNDK